jgi:Second Messenger Oligonucleotide or Dinucleotide Synthetase domain
VISTQEAFKKFRNRLELTQREQDDASRRQKEIRAIMDDGFEIDHDFLTGSYARWTKTKPLKDVDIFCVLKEKEHHYRDKHPSILINEVKSVLAVKYGEENVSNQRRSVTVDFGIKEIDGETDEKIMSFDVVPAFIKNDYYEIPDISNPSGWTSTNPKIHASKATEANKAYSGEWKGLVRMIKAWNRVHEKPIKPSFLIEVMALEVLYPPFGGNYGREMQAFFATLASRIGEIWGDPAGLGPDVSDSMDTQKIAAAKTALLEAEQQAAHALRLEREGKQSEVLKTWRNLFGPLFPLS